MLHCPKCGSLSFNFDGEKHYNCEQCGYQFFFNAATAVGALIMQNGKLLTGIRANNPGKGKLDLPGGFVDPGESLEEALERELQEELSIRPTSMKYFSSGSNYYLYEEVEYITCDAYFICKIDSFEGMVASDDISEYRWVTLSDINLSEFAFDSAKQAVEKLGLFT